MAVGEATHGRLCRASAGESRPRRPFLALGILKAQRIVRWTSAILNGRATDCSPNTSRQEPASGILFGLMPLTPRGCFAARWQGPSLLESLAISLWLSEDAAAAPALHQIPH